MPPKKDNLPINVDVDLENGGTITYANEVIAIIAGVAASEIDGIAGMCASGGMGDIFGRNRNITRGVKVEIGSEEASVDLYTIVEYGKPIQKVASEVQENVRKAIETMTGLHVVRVDVHVQGVSFEKEKREMQTGIEAAAEKPAIAEPVSEDAPMEAGTFAAQEIEVVDTVEETTMTEETEKEPENEPVINEAVAEEKQDVPDAVLPDESVKADIEQPCDAQDAPACAESAAEEAPIAEEKPADEPAAEDAKPAPVKRKRKG